MRKRLVRNVVANLLQAVLGAGLLFALYRYINDTLGVEQLGVWSVVLAAASASRLADLGLSVGVTRFVARDRARDNARRAGKVLDTTALTLMVTVGLILPLAYPIIHGLLPYLFDDQYLQMSQQILPYALLSLWLTIIATVFQGGLDGCERMDLRSALVVSGQVLLLALAFWLVPQHGLIGLAWAQVGQGLFLVVAGRLMLVHTLNVLPIFPMRWRWQVLREMLGYGANVQAATVFMLLLDPVAKAMMAGLGGAAAAGYFEMASQVVQRGRAMIVAANQAVVPRVAALTEGAPGQLSQFYRMNMRLIVFITLPVFSLLVAWAGGVSWLLTGSYQEDFVAMMLVLTIAWAANTLTVPAYFFNLGGGRVGWNTLSHMAMGICNAGLGWLLGSIYGWPGVVLGYSIALLVGSAVLILAFVRRHEYARTGAAGPAQYQLVLTCLLVAVFGWLVPLRPTTGITPALLAGMLLPPLALGVAAWLHPMRKQLAQMLGFQERGV